MKSVYLLVGLMVGLVFLSVNPVAAQGTFAYVSAGPTGGTPGEVSVIDTTTAAVVATIPVGLLPRTYHGYIFILR